MQVLHHPRSCSGVGDVLHLMHHAPTNIIARPNCQQWLLRVRVWDDVAVTPTMLAVCRNSLCILMKHIPGNVPVNCLAIRQPKRQLSIAAHCTCSHPTSGPLSG